MSHQTRLETLQALKAEVLAEAQELLKRMDELRHEESLLNDLLQHYASTSNAVAIMPEPRPIQVRLRVSPSGTSIPNEIVAVLRDAGQPLHYRHEILPRLLERGVKITGQDLARNVSAHLQDPRFARVPDRPGYWTLAMWVSDRGGNAEPLETPGKAIEQQPVADEQTDKPLAPAGPLAVPENQEGHRQWVEVANPALLKRRYEGSTMMT